MVKSTPIYQWAYFQDNGPDTALTVVSLDNSTATHTRNTTYPLPGKPWAMVYQNPNCKVLRLVGPPEKISLNR